MQNETKIQNFSWVDAFKAVWFFLEKDKKRFVIFSCILSIIFLYSLVPAFVVGKVVDFFTEYRAGESLTEFYLYIIFLGSTYVVASLIRLYSKQVVSIIGQRNRARARISGFERLTEFSLEWHNKENTGSKIQRLFTGGEALKLFMAVLTKDVFKIFADTAGVLVVFLFVDAKLAILTLVYFVVFLFVEFTLSKKFYKLANEFNKLNQKAGGVYMESANNMLAIKAMGSENSINIRIATKEKQSRDASIEKSKAGYTKWYFLQFVNGVTLMLFVLLVGQGVVDKSISIGMILVFFTYFMKLRDALGDFSDLYTTLIDLRSEIGQMMPIFYETEFIKTGSDCFPVDWDKIEMKNINMDYGSGQSGLDDFNLVLKRNTKTGIAGLSGSGKSTLAKIVLGLYKIKSGAFTIGGKDYYSISHNETLSNATVVLQETELFNLSLRDNITMMREVNNELLEQAIKISELDAVIKKLPDGLDATIGEKGYMLSGGERQRLGIARAIYKNAPIIILDEATSSLDSETEAKIMEKLLGVYGNDKTFLIIAHRLGTLKYTDNIAVMEGGKVLEEGSYGKLINDSKSVFYRMNNAKSNEK